MVICLFLIGIICCSQCIETKVQMCVIHVQVKRWKNSKQIFNFLTISRPYTVDARVCVQFSWPLSKVDMKRLNTWERKILGRIYGLVVEQGSWRMRTDQELCELYKDLDIVTDVNLQEPCVLYIGRTYRYPPDVSFYIYIYIYIFFFNKYKYWVF